MANIVLLQSILPRAAAWSPSAKRGGHVAFVLQWLEGLRRLGHNVLFVNISGPMVEPERSAAVQQFEFLMQRWWDLRNSVLFDPEREMSLAGCSYERLRLFAAGADALLTVALSGSREPPPPLDRIHPRIFVDQDPGYTQLWSQMHGPEAIIGKHDVYCTVGANVGTSRSGLPTTGLTWHHTWNPVVPAWWPVDHPITRNRWTTIADWWGQPYVEFDGRVLGPKRDEFMKIANLPRLAGTDIELALDIPADDADIPVLHAEGWKVSTPEDVESVDGYQRWVAGSLAEFSCAKGVYVGTNSGWFSDRSAAYLTCGRPVVLQDTGFSDVLPTGEGLIAFDGVFDAADAIREVAADYARHSRAARRLAMEYFAHERVLPPLLTIAGL